MVYIQSRLDGQPHHFDAACALYGAEEANQEWKLISYEQLKSGAFDSLISRNLFVGSVEFMNEVFNRMPLKNHPRVPANSDREHSIMTLKDVRDKVRIGQTVFVKPLKIKAFTGLVVDQMTISSLKIYPDEMQVMVYKVFSSPILSEWRCYIHEGRMVDARNYSGDFTITPNFTYIQKTIGPFCREKKFPCAFTIDVAVLDFIDAEITEVVEFNDMWAIGNYGMPNDLYYRLLKDRYFEIVKSRWDDIDTGTKLT